MSLVAYATDSEDSLEGLSDSEKQVDPSVHEKSDEAQIGTSGNQDRVMNKNYEKELLENAENAGMDLEQMWKKDYYLSTLLLNMDSQEKSLQSQG